MPTHSTPFPTNDCLDCKGRSLRMFCNLAPEALTDFNRIGTIVMLMKGAVLFREDDLGDRVSVVCSGQVKLSCGSKDGKTLNLKIAVPGDVLGLSSVISGARLEVTAEAMEATSVKIVSRAEFIPFLERHGEASMHAARALSDEYKSAFADARRLALSGSVAGRLASLLMDWGRSAACEATEMRFTMALTHDDLANFTGTSRESVTRTLGKFQSEKLITIQGSSVHILAPEKLAQLSA